MRYSPHTAVTATDGAGVYTYSVHQTDTHEQLAVDRPGTHAQTDTSKT